MSKKAFGSRLKIPELSFKTVIMALILGMAVAHTVIYESLRQDIHKSELRNIYLTETLLDEMEKYDLYWPVGLDTVEMEQSFGVWKAATKIRWEKINTGNYSKLVELLDLKRRPVAKFFWSDWGSLDTITCSMYVRPIDTFPWLIDSIESGEPE